MKFMILFTFLSMASCSQTHKLPLNVNVYFNEISKSKNAALLNLTFNDWNKRFSRDSIISTVNDKRWQKCIVVEIGNTNERSYSAIIVGQLKSNQFEKCLINDSIAKWSNSNSADYQSLKNETNRIKNDFGVLDGNMVILTKIDNNEYSTLIFYGKNNNIYRLIGE